MNEGGTGKERRGGGSRRAGSERSTRREERGRRMRSEGKAAEKGEWTEWRKKKEREGRCVRGVGWGQVRHCPLPTCKVICVFLNQRGTYLTTRVNVPDRFH